MPTVESKLVSSVVVEHIIIIIINQAVLNMKLHQGGFFSVKP